MSGGAYDYLCYRVEDVAQDMEYKILEQLITDVSDLLKSLEWYKSGDTSQKDYHKDAEKFINKWLTSDKCNYINKIDEVKKRLLDVLDEEMNEA